MSPGRGGKDEGRAADSQRSSVPGFSRGQWQERPELEQQDGTEDLVEEDQLREREKTGRTEMRIRPLTEE